ncbi:MAG: signal peptidase I [Myxococcales bacterium]|nr:MAG: signal peptidase I [Myxococcales bacterium]
MGKWLRTIGWTAIVLAVILGALRATVLRWWRVPTDDPTLGASLAPSLYPGDFVLLWRGTVKFGDLARCADPEAPGRYVVGRIMGEPNDDLELGGDTVSVNGKRSVQEHSCSPGTVSIPDPTSGAPTDLHCGVETIIGHKHKRGTSAASAHILQRKVQVGPGQFYLVSDNRAMPFDSRNYGGLPQASCKETVFFRLHGAKGFGDVETRLTFIQ